MKLARELAGLAAVLLPQVCMGAALAGLALGSLYVLGGGLWR